MADRGKVFLSNCLKWRIWKRKRTRRTPWRKRWCSRKQKRRPGRGWTEMESVNKAWALSAKPKDRLDWLDFPFFDADQGAANRRLFLKLEPRQAIERGSHANYSCLKADKGRTKNEIQGLYFDRWRWGTHRIGTQGGQGSAGSHQGRYYRRQAQYHPRQERILGK